MKYHKKIKKSNTKTKNNALIVFTNAVSVSGKCHKALQVAHAAAMHNAVNDLDLSVSNVCIYCVKVLSYI